MRLCFFTFSLLQRRLPHGPTGVRDPFDGSNLIVLSSQSSQVDFTDFLVTSASIIEAEYNNLSECCSFRCTHSIRSSFFLWKIDFYRLFLFFTKRILIWRKETCYVYILSGNRKLWRHKIKRANRESYWLSLGKADVAAVTLHCCHNKCNSLFTLLQLAPFHSKPAKPFENGAVEILERDLVRK